ncbi:hypothetical protein SAMN05421810_10275 [Amycolatopsis arida]|uniref:Uncharacterized protein n=1 Tax=Amycolatopsis arida TaxID=587909 RepID=A0A1I5NYS8_9PSEU|nr:hypothetical protein CLV69_10175 [Amycolatopsis arida]SFP26760.1 hypothetical protein SAMN05421810_10275 [Amycolatopsis arida]
MLAHRCPPIDARASSGALPVPRQGSHRLFSRRWHGDQKSRLDMEVHLPFGCCRRVNNSSGSEVAARHDGSPPGAVENNRTRTKLIRSHGWTSAGSSRGPARVLGTVGTAQKSRLDMEAHLPFRCCRRVNNSSGSEVAARHDGSPPGAVENNRTRTKLIRSHGWTSAGSSRGPARVLGTVGTAQKSRLDTVAHLRFSSSDGRTVGRRRLRSHGSTRWVTSSGTNVKPSSPMSCSEVTAGHRMPPLCYQNERGRTHLPDQKSRLDTRNTSDRRLRIGLGDHRRSPTPSMSSPTRNI